MLLQCCRLHIHARIAVRCFTQGTPCTTGRPAILQISILLLLPVAAQRVLHSSTSVSLSTRPSCMFSIACCKRVLSGAMLLLPDSVTCESPALETRCKAAFISLSAAVFRSFFCALSRHFVSSQFCLEASCSMTGKLPADFSSRPFALLSTSLLPLQQAKSVISTLPSLP